MTNLDQAANAILIAYALSIPVIIFVGLARGDRSELGRAIRQRAIRLNNNRERERA